MKNLIHFSFCFLLFQTSFCQSPQWRVYNTYNSGLPDSIIFSISLDKFGNKWIGTGYNGVAKFDNSNWTIYNTSNSGISRNNILAIHIDALNNKWFGFLSGVISKFDDKNWTNYDPENTNGVLFAPVGTRDIITDKFGNLLIGTDAYGIKSYDGKLWSNATFIKDVFITDFALDKKGNLWVGQYYHGAVYYDGTNTKIYSTVNAFMPSNDITSIAIEKGGIVWMATKENGIVKLEGEKLTVFNMSNSELPTNYFNKVIIDNNNNKWFATAEDGIIKYDGNKWITYNTLNSGIPSNNITSFAIDNNNNLWMGTRYDGVAVFNEKGVDLELKDAVKEVTIYPNPFESQIEFHFEKKQLEDYDLTIKNSLGRVIAEKKINPTDGYYKLDLSELINGMYFITITNKNGETLFKKLIKT